MEGRGAALRGAILDPPSYARYTERALHMGEAFVCAAQFVCIGRDSWQKLAVAKSLQRHS